MANKKTPARQLWPDPSLTSDWACQLKTQSATWRSSEPIPGVAPNRSLARSTRARPASSLSHFSKRHSRDGQTPGHGFLTWQIWTIWNMVIFISYSFSPILLRTVLCFFHRVHSISSLMNSQTFVVIIIGIWDLLLTPYFAIWLFLDFKLTYSTLIATAFPADSIVFSTLPITSLKNDRIFIFFFFISCASAFCFLCLWKQWATCLLDGQVTKLNEWRQVRTGDLENATLGTGGRWPLFQHDAWQQTSSG